MNSTFEPRPGGADALGELLAAHGRHGHGRHQQIDRRSLLLEQHQRPFRDVDHETWRVAPQALLDPWRR